MNQQTYATIKNLNQKINFREVAHENNCYGECGVFNRGSGRCPACEYYNNGEEQSKATKDMIKLMDSKR